MSVVPTTPSFSSFRAISISGLFRHSVSISVFSGVSCASQTMGGTLDPQPEGEVTKYYIESVNPFGDSSNGTSESRLYFETPTVAVEVAMGSGFGAPYRP